MTNLTEMYSEIQPLIDNGSTEEAISAMEQLLNEHPDFGEGFNDLAGLYLESGDKQKAGELYQKAVDCDPQNNVFLKSLADYYHVEMENVNKALSLYQRMIENGVEDADIFFIAANLSIVEQRLEDAVDLYEKVLDLQPWHAEAFDFLEKVKSYLENNGSNNSVPSTESLYDEATALGVAGDNAAALAKLEELIARDPDNALAHNDMGVYHYRLGNEEKSLEHYRMATTLDPFNATFQKNLADYLCFVKGDVLDGLAIYLRLLKEDSEDVEVLMAAGLICHEIGRLSDAELFFGRVIEIEPWNIEAGNKLDELQALQQQQSDVS